MTFGFQQGGGFGQHKQSLGFDASASEKLRIIAATKERLRIEKERAKSKTTELERKLEHNKMDLSHRLTEMRRLETEIIHTQTEVQSMEREIVLLDQKEHQHKVHSVDSKTHVEKVTKDIQEHKRIVESQGRVATHLEGQITQLQQQLAIVKRSILDTNSEIQKLTLSVKQLENEANSENFAAQHSKSDREYKLKELENKKKSERILEDKKQQEAQEVERIKAENIRLEIDIKMLAIKLR